MGNSKRFTLVGVLACSAAIGLSGCTTMENVGLPNPEKEMRARGASTTGVTAAAGAAIGATAGLIVGSTAGAAGEGLVLGAIAGAATGGLVGDEFETYEKEVSDKDETITRQEEVITNQWREIDELKEQLEGLDVKPSVRRDAYSLDTYKGNPKAKSWNRLAKDTKTAELPASRAAMATPPAIRTASPSSLPPAKKVASAVPAPELKTTIETTEPKKPALPAGVKPKAKTLADIAPAKKPVVAKKLPAEPVKPIPAVVAKPAPQKEVAKVAEPEPRKLITRRVSTTGCAKAEEEVERATSSTSNADKLFYLRRALRLCPKEPQYHLRAGEVYAAIGRRDDAEFEFRRAIELDPNNEHAHEQLMLLQNEGA